MSDEIPLTAQQIVARIPGSRGAPRLHVSTVHRWIITGCPGRDGTRVKLRAFRAGKRWLVYQADLDQFFDALAGNSDPTPPPRTPTQRAKASRAAGARLEAAGA
jgi:hypothetical protein